jgi:AraC-like DNA-binding protein
VLRAVVAAVEAARAGQGSALLRELALPPAALEGADARVPFALVLRAWELAGDLSGDPDFGLHLAERTPVGAFDVIDYVARTRNTLGDALRTLARYQRLLHDLVRLTVEPEGDRVYVRHGTEGYPAGITRHAAEAALATPVQRARSLCREPLRILEVSFQHPAPADTREHARIFRAPVRFGAARTEVAVAASCMQLPLSSSDPTLSAILVRQADDILARSEPAGDLRAAVRRALAGRLEASDIGLEAVAARLAMSPRSLQRGLAAEGTRLSTVIDELRRDLAVGHLDAGRLSLAEIGFVLGFSEPSAFHRAFRRWTGTTPDAYRRSRTP